MDGSDTGLDALIDRYEAFRGGPLPEKLRALDELSRALRARGRSYRRGGLLYASDDGSELWRIRQATGRHGNNVPASEHRPGRARDAASGYQEPRASRGVVSPLRRGYGSRRDDTIGGDRF